MFAVSWVRTADLSISLNYGYLIGHDISGHIPNVSSRLPNYRYQIGLKLCWPNKIMEQLFTNTKVITNGRLQV